MINAINWFEIPAKDFARAKKFYETVLGGTVNEMPHPQLKYGMLPGNTEDGVGGGLVQGEGYQPSANGTMVYLNGKEDLNIALSRVEKAGGKVLLPKTSIGQNGFMAHFLDTEGNKVALHSMK